MLVGGFVAAEADGGNLESIHSQDVVLAFDDHQPVLMQGFADIVVLHSGGVAAVEFGSSMKSADVTMFGRFLAVRATVANPASVFLLKGKIAAGVTHDFATFIAVRVYEILLSEEAPSIAGDPANSLFLQQLGRHPTPAANVLGGFGTHFRDVRDQIIV